MGREARTLKDRECKHCKMKFYQTGKEMTAHAELCVRAVRNGLVLPGAIERPGNVIRSGKNYTITRLDDNP